MQKKKVSFFISYARKNNKSKQQFLDLFKEHTNAAKGFEYTFWDDRDIVVGDDWHEAIQEAIQHCDFGIMLVSLAFVGSSYIVDNELKHYLKKGGKRCFPVMLGPVYFNMHDLKGLESKQIFRLESDDFKTPRAFSELSNMRRKEEFVLKFFSQIHNWMGHEKG